MPGEYMKSLLSGKPLPTKQDRWIMRYGGGGNGSFYRRKQHNRGG